MVERDRFGLVLSTTSPIAAENYRSFVDCFLASQGGAREFLRTAIAGDGDFALARIADAFMRFANGDAEGAKRSAAEATALGAGATERERSHVAAFASRINREARSADLFKRHVGENPLDVVTVFVSQGALAFSGRRTWKEEIAALTDSVVAHYDPKEWSILGLRAFLAEEDRNIDEARRLSGLSLEIHPANARAAHVMSHTYFELAEHLAGGRFLRQWISSNDPLPEFGAHLWWHLALHQLGLADRVGAIDSLHTGIASGGRSPFVIADRASLLWRLDLYGLGADERDWQDVSDMAAEMVRTPGFPFIDAHVVLAHAGAQSSDRVTTFVDQLEARAAEGIDVAGDVLMPLARGITAFSEGRFRDAARHLGNLVSSGEIVRVGGSNAQREVFEDTLIGALIADGQRSAARTLITQRLARRPSWVDDRWRSTVDP
jgi:hypothetical protein